MTFTRAQLVEIPAGTEILRTVRHWQAADVADITDDELDNARRWMLAAAYSCNEGARRIAMLLAERNRPPTCSRLADCAAPGHFYNCASFDHQPKGTTPCESELATTTPASTSNPEPTATPAPL